MKRILLISILLHVTISMAFCQSVPELRNIADDHFEKENYLKAIEFYQKVVGIDKRDIDSRFNLAISYFKTFQFDQAREQLEMLARSDDQNISATSLLYYGNILKLNKDYESADSIYTYILKNLDVDEYLLAQAKKEREGAQLAISQESVERGFSIAEMENLNSEYHDFGASVNRKQQTLAYVTTKNVGNRQLQSTQFEGLLPDLVLLRQRNNGRWQNVTNRNNFDQVKSEWAEGSGCFTADGTAFYFTSCRSNEGADCQIMVTRFVDDNWSEPVALNEYINLPGYENKQPYLSITGDTLFFASNRPGGFGESDIWMSLRGLDEESWTPAINLGEVINTQFNEITPFYSSAYNSLIFASNGHVGYGGYDLFIAKGESFFEPDIYNLGPPFNSQLDDTYFYIYDSAGYISSNRKDRVYLDLYDFEVKDEPLFLSLLISGESMIDSRVVSRYKQIRSIDLTTFRIEDYQGFELFDPVKRKKPKPDILRDNPFNEEESVAENSDDVKDQTYYPEVLPAKTSEGPERTYSTSFYQNYADVNTEGRVAYEKVFFGFDKSTLNNDGRLALESLAAQMRDQSDKYEYIEIRVYTDPIGSEAYNQKLSAQRGQQVQAYLASLGLPKVKLSVIPEGEKNLLSKGNQWYDNLFNRRAEIYIKTDQQLKIQKARKLVLRKDMTLQECAQRLGITEKDLLETNTGLKTLLKKGEVLRLPLGSQIPDIRYFLEEQDINHKFFAYTVKQGDTLYSLSKRFNNPEELIKELNNLDNSLNTGETIYLYKSL
jgi:outer membrane protein OmpA-like peptidoglycan-associated protein/LysM repeat protein